MRGWPGEGKTLMGHRGLKDDPVATTGKEAAFPGGLCLGNSGRKRGFLRNSLLDQQVDKNTR